MPEARGPHRKNGRPTADASAEGRITSFSRSADRIPKAKFPAENRARGPAAGLGLTREAPHHHRGHVEVLVQGLDDLVLHEVHARGPPRLQHVLEPPRTRKGLETEP